MNINTTLITLVAAATLFGCGNTANGIEKDAEANGEKASKSIENASNSTAEATKDASAAAILTPKIKLAITAETLLNDSKNEINVDSTEEKVMLEGHVSSEKLKELAGSIAMKVLKDSNAKQTVDNQLKVMP